ncbi:phage protein [Clostridium sporogenes]|uniref:Uncharacterized protein n=1 Tax=Clostridium sporogenes TaxID=1509 RepID=A0A7U4JPX9_CLOSG|nr:hypothetical protein [Clostridium sporogenes]AKC63141.1 hypothetical protein CLSPO_c24210 [Clostridium sporogenes]AKJ90345.1 hypothetical protein CLSPOx_12140 [Clostridium sporogenes]KCZ67828.1 hypothetical protein CSPO_7c01710 [Clostridium sporogenes]OOO65504.1 hypothetical protein BS099_14560 [Clostridium sporogenes]SQC39990.1 phage protein [Clostridium sporogenes]
METFTIILFLIGCIGAIVSIILIIKNTIKKQDNKRNKKILIGSIILSIVAFIAFPTKSNTKKDVKTNNKVATENKSILSSKDKELLKKHYEDFEPGQIEQFDKIQKKYEKMPSKEKESIKSDYERLLKEQAIQVKKWEDKEKKKAEEEKAAEAKKWNDFVNKNTKELSAGEHTVGTHIDAGAYDVTFNGSGNFNIYSADGSLLTNEIGGNDLGIDKYRIILTQGNKIKISSMSVNMKPIKRSLVPYKETSIYSGYWICGQDITEGRYKAIVESGQGNFVIYGKSGGAKTNEILGGDIGVKEVIINLEDGDIINVAGLKSVKLVPEK